MQLDKITDAGGQPVANRPFRRRVFYIPGYDPFHPRRYRELYRTEAAAQAAISGHTIDLKPKSVKGSYGWQVASEIEGRAVAAEVEVLVWSDLVRESMGMGVLASYGQVCRTAWIYLSTGALFRLLRLRKGPAIAALYPVAMLLAQLALVLGVAALAGGLLAEWLHWSLGLAAAAVIVPFGLRWFRAHDNRLFAYYLLHDYAWSAQHWGANPPALDTRLAAFADRIRAALTEGFDEVLVVGHSSGAHLAVTVLADVIRGGVPSGTALGFLSLGQVVPMLSFLPKAGRLRGDLAYLSQSEALTWIDVTAPGDGCAFALCDPVAVTGVAPTGKRWPLVISAAFTQSLSPERWRALRWRFFRLHFQYLCAFDRPRDYDYFRITAGPLTLAERYANRAASKSRLETPVNPYRSLA
jgi:hypothetical protein